jgi:endonuclease YncB( thermonuclease family)
MYEYNCKIVRVVYGDTLDVDIDLGFDTWRCNQRIYLYGIDIPECCARDAEEKSAKFLAKEFVEESTARRRNVQTNYPREKTSSGGT